MVKVVDCSEKDIDNIIKLRLQYFKEVKGRLTEEQISSLSKVWGTTYFCI